ncbi:hypothetical protein [Algoriphagus aquimarinus]|uniref:hypothetical protein n=1 Tax=Algoriphagus aquimarinus TaxID=237018 RepID=UPI0030DCE462
MRYLCLLVIAACTVSLSSCRDVEEPISPLIGAWENRVFVDSLNYWIVERYDFVNDSTYDIKVTVRESETSKDLGYRFATRGWYNLQENAFTFTYSEIYQVKDYYLPSRANLYAPKNELRFIEIDFSDTPTANLTFSTDGKQFEFLAECLEYYSECSLPKTYIKIN